MRLERVRASQDRCSRGWKEAGQGRAGQGRAGKGRARQGCKGQGRIGQGRAEQACVGQECVGQGVTWYVPLPASYPAELPTFHHCLVDPCDQPHGQQCLPAHPTALAARQQPCD